MGLATDRGISVGTLVTSVGAAGLSEKILRVGDFVQVIAIWEGETICKISPLQFTGPTRPTYAVKVRYLRPRQIAYDNNGKIIKKGVRVKTRFVPNTLVVDRVKETSHGPVICLYESYGGPTLECSPPDIFVIFEDKRARRRKNRRMKKAGKRKLAVLNRLNSEIYQDNTVKSFVEKIFSRG